MADLQLIRREQSALGDVILEIQRGPEDDEEADAVRQQLDALGVRQSEARRVLDAAREQLSRLQGQADMIGTDGERFAQSCPHVRSALCSCKSSIRR